MLNEENKLAKGGVQEMDLSRGEVVISLYVQLSLFFTIDVSYTCYSLKVCELYACMVLKFMARHRMSKSELCVYK